MLWIIPFSLVIGGILSSNGEECKNKAKMQNLLRKQQEANLEKIKNEDDDLPSNIKYEKNVYKRYCGLMSDKQFVPFFPISLYPDKPHPYEILILRLPKFDRFLYKIIIIKAHLLCLR